MVAAGLTVVEPDTGLLPTPLSMLTEVVLVVFDPAYRGSISAKTQHMNVDYSAFEGWPLEGRASVVTVRGEVAARDGKFTGRLGRGQFLQRKPTHF